ncbi:hypothetical protein N5P32_01175 [Marinomonas pontica]|uniref:hypothetical protein n=1 Tax=Marinomonas pontica TaxID=264739 RepID=UPI0022434485|nr:hypothetical protein [Marinomonas pontica]MCW8354597.1 hypothetical protein [Marinomonas pontica]
MSVISASEFVLITYKHSIILKGKIIMALKPGPKPKAKSTGKTDQRRRDNKKTPGNTPDLKPSKSSGK